MEYHKLSEIKKLPGNPRIIRDKQFKTLCDSIRDNPKYFEARPVILSNRTGEMVIIAGNQRYEAAKSLKLKEVPTFLIEGLDEAKEREIIIRDNISNGEFDMSALANEWSDLPLADWGVDLPDDWLTAPTGEPADAEPQIDRAEELNKTWRVKTGDLWQIGDHRLLCGDSTKKEDVGRVMGGEKATVMVTDPPYGVDYEGGVVNKSKREKLEGDKTTDLFKPALGIAAKFMDGGAWYVWHADRHAAPVYAAIEAAGFEIRALLIWNKIKAHYGAPSAHYCQKHEPCLYAVKGNAEFTGPSNECTVWDIDQPSHNEHHPTQKPLECMARAIRNHGTNGAIIIDPFLGSGTTMVACQNLNRKCRGIEISPDYCAVILQRMTDAFPGIEIKKHK